MGGGCQGGRPLTRWQDDWRTGCVIPETDELFGKGRAAPRDVGKLLSRDGRKDRAEIGRQAAEIGIKTQEWKKDELGGKRETL